MQAIGRRACCSRAVPGRPASELPTGVLPSLNALAAPHSKELGDRLHTTHGAGAPNRTPLNCRSAAIHTPPVVRTPPNCPSAAIHAPSVVRTPPNCPSAAIHTTSDSIQPLASTPHADHAASPANLTPRTAAPCTSFDDLWAGQVSNLRHPACKASALPLSYPPGARRSVRKQRSGRVYGAVGG